MLIGSEAIENVRSKLGKMGSFQSRGLNMRRKYSNGDSKSDAKVHSNADKTGKYDVDVYVNGNLIQSLEYKIRTREYTLCSASKGNLPCAQANGYCPSQITF